MDGWTASPRCVRKGKSAACFLQIYASITGEGGASFQFDRICLHDGQLKQCSPVALVDGIFFFFNMSKIESGIFKSQFVSTSLSNVYI